MRGKRKSRNVRTKSTNSLDGDEHRVVLPIYRIGAKGFFLVDIEITHTVPLLQPMPVTTSILFLWLLSPVMTFCTTGSAY